MKEVIAVAYGAGTNSTAMLVGFHENSIRPDLILFANTGGERPHTYKHLKDVSSWCLSVGFPEIVVVEKGGIKETLEENCLRMNMLPSIAYGYKSCSQKYKRQPQDKYVNNWELAKEVWKRGGKVIKAIGYDADEERRAKNYDDEKYKYWYPLIEWGWGRDECLSAISRAGLPQAGKSSCFFCPSMKVAEIHQLRDENPDLFRRALVMEENANLTSIKGLGRRFAWRDHAHGGALSGVESFSLTVETPCDCYDGD